MCPECHDRGYVSSSMGQAYCKAEVCPAREALKKKLEQKK